jgi:hypothetical protein
MVHVLGVTLTYDQAIAGAALIVGILATVAGVWAAVFATRADSATRRAMRDSDQRHDQEIRPRLEPVGVRNAEYQPANFRMEIANRGGATPLFVFTVQSAQHVYITSGTLDEHTREPFDFTYVGDLSYGTGYFSTPFVVAQDRLGRWWDCTLQHFLAGRLIEGSFRRWIDARLAERGLQKLLDVQLTIRVLDYRSEDMLLQIDRMMSKRARPFLTRLPWLSVLLVRGSRRRHP